LENRWLETSPQWRPYAAEKRLLQNDGKDHGNNFKNLYMVRIFKIATKLLLSNNLEDSASKIARLISLVLQVDANQRK
jgi:hypothetical protein